MRNLEIGIEIEEHIACLKKEFIAVCAKNVSSSFGSMSIVRMRRFYILIRSEDSHVTHYTLMSSLSSFSADTVKASVAMQL